MGSVAFASPFVPPEWIAAHGLRPTRLRPRTGMPARAITARGVCPFAGGVVDQLDALAKGRSNSDDAALDAVVLTTTCDQMRYIAAFLNENRPLPLFLLNFPSTWQPPAARHLYREELQRLGRFLVGLGGTVPRPGQLAVTMREYDADRAAARFAWSGGETDGASQAIRLATVGGPPASDGEFVALVERAGGRIVLDAGPYGERALPRPFDESRLAEDPLGELADAYFDIPDVFQRPNTRLYEWLGERIAERGIRGMLFFRTVFCDLWHAELQRMREWSPVPIMDIDVPGGEEGRAARTVGRIEAFLEMLQ